jgi:hypothetical protein
MYVASKPCRCRRSAAAAAELAIVATVLVVLMTVSVDFARLFFSYLTITSCARDGAVVGALNAQNMADNTAGNTAMTTTALKDVQNWPTVPTATAHGGVADADGNKCVTVTVSWTFSTIIKYPGWSQNYPLSRTVQMRVGQGQPS